MIVRPRPHWLRLLLVWRGSVLPRILPQLVVVSLLSVVAVMFHGELFHWKITLTAVPFSLVGVALAIFLGFRLTASYDRYWEARKLWGAILTESRNLARQAQTLTDTDAAAVREFVLVLVAFGHALRHQLRGIDSATGMAELAPLLPPAFAARLRASTQRPVMLLLWLGEWVAMRRRRDEISPVLNAAMEGPLARLSEALAGCERIVGTPIPFSYAVIIHRTVYLYSFLLPFGLVDGIGWMTPPIVAFVSYTFFALEAFSDEIEEPFGLMANDLALDNLTTRIERSLREMLGDDDLPSERPAQNWILT